MTRFTTLLGIALISAAVAAEPQPRVASEQENERQPGTLQITGLHDTDRVLIDGEFLGDGKRIAQFGSKLLITPGDYTVTIVSAREDACAMKVAVRENRTSTATCSTESDEEIVD